MVQVNPPNVDQGGTFEVDNSVTVLNNRVQTGVALYGGTLLLNNSTSAVAQTLGTLTVGAGASTINSTVNGAAVTTTFTSITRTVGSGGTLNVTGTGLGAAGNQIFFTGVVTGTLLPYATFGGTSLGYYTTATGIVANNATNNAN